MNTMEKPQFHVHVNPIHLIAAHLRNNGPRNMEMEIEPFNQWFRIHIAVPHYSKEERIFKTIEVSGFYEPHQNILATCLRLLNSLQTKMENVK